jgi:phosphate transport system permease protein
MSEPTPDKAKGSKDNPPLQPGLGEIIGVAGGLPAIEPPSISAIVRRLPPEVEGPPPDLEKRLRSPRTLVSAILSVVTGVMAVAAMVPLFSVLFMLIWRGGQRFSIELFTQVAPAPGMEGGGIGNALVGTLLMVAIASAIAVPFGILAAVYLSEFGPETAIASAVRFSIKVLSGMPSVLAGLFAYAVVVLATGTYSAPAGGVALSILMLPTVLLTAEQALKMVPHRMREAAIGMGATRTQVVWQVVLPTATPGILTGVMLAVARAAGETAPLLFTAMYSAYWLTPNPMEPTASLAVLIFNFSSQPFRNRVEIAWAASLVLVIFVMLANVAAQVWSARAAKR